MRGTIPPLPNTPSWRGAQLKSSTGTTLPLTFTVPLMDKHTVPSGMSVYLYGR
jgi:hypothetical protein